MKKSVILIAALTAIFAMTGCGAIDENTNIPQTNTSVAETTAAVTTDAAEEKAAETTEPEKKAEEKTDDKTAEKESEDKKVDDKKTEKESEDKKVDDKKTEKADDNKSAKTESGNSASAKADSGSDNKPAENKTNDNTKNENNSSNNEDSMSDARQEQRCDIMVFAPTPKECKVIVDNLQMLDYLMCMSPAVVTYDENEAFCPDEYTTYYKVTDGEFSSIDEIRSFLQRAATSDFIADNYNGIIDGENTNFIEIDGDLYVLYRPIGGIYSFVTDDMQVAEKTEHGYLVTVTDTSYGGNQLIGIEVIYDDDYATWLISSVRGME